MNYKVAKTLQVVLLVIAIIAFIVGSIITKVYTDMKNHDPEKITIGITSVKSEALKDGSTTYYKVTFDFYIKNGTKETVEDLYINTTIFQKGKEVTELNVEFTDMELKKGEETTMSYYITANSINSSNSFKTLYNASYKDLTFDFIIKNIAFEDNYLVIVKDYIPQKMK